jgi:hypothetical protein
MFCGREGTLTREHVLRKKWRKYFGAAPQDFLDRHTVPDRSGGPHIQTQNAFTGIPFDRTVRAVCKDCNEGWMERLEEAVEPVLLGLIQGQPGHLDRSDLEIVTRWVAKTAFVMERMDTSPNAAGEDQRRAVMEGSLPPRFHAFVRSLEPNTEYRLRSTPLRPPDGSEAYVFRFVTIHFHQVHFLAVTASNAEAEQKVQGFAQYITEELGWPTWALPDGLDLPNQEPAPVASVQQLHDYVALVIPHLVALNEER